MTSVYTGRQIVFSALTVLVVAGICYPFSAPIGYRSVALILLLTVSILAMRQGLPAVLTAAILSALVWDYFFIPPQFTFHIDSTEDALFMVMYFIVASLSGIINHRLRQLDTLRREKDDRESALKLYNTLFSSLSHDLRTPIAVVLGAADTLRENDKQLSINQRSKLLDEIFRGAIRLNEQVENLLNMSRIEAGMIHSKPAWCDLGDLLYSVLKKNVPDSATHSVKISIPENFPLVQLDFGLTEQILHNLISNALRHTPSGSTISISANIKNEIHGHFISNDQHTELTTVKKPTGHRLILKISDDGNGFPPDEIEYVFDKFYRPGDTKADGSGIGLFVVRGFTEAQSGEIELRNLPDGGACFTIEIPTIVLNQTFHHD